MPLEALIPREAGWSRFKLALRFTDSKEPDLVRDRSGFLQQRRFQGGTRDRHLATRQLRSGSYRRSDKSL